MYEGIRPLSPIHLKSMCWRFDDSMIRLLLACFFELLAALLAALAVSLACWLCY